MTDLSRFITAQNRCFDRVLAELTAGRKDTHWMWFVFPQIAGLGLSDTARYYALKSQDEARAYLADDLLGSRLRQMVKLVLGHRNLTLAQIFGHPDDLKFVSCMTLFVSVAGEDDNCFADALSIFNGGRRDKKTLALIIA